MYSFLSFFCFFLGPENVNFTSISLGYWTISAMRTFMENFAKIRNLDPLLPDTWYNISSDEIRKDKVLFTYFLLIIIICNEKNRNSNKCKLSVIGFYYIY
jgi:hypothetical protein